MFSIPPPSLSLSLCVCTSWSRWKLNRTLISQLDKGNNSLKIYEKNRCFNAIEIYQMPGKKRFNTDELWNVKWKYYSKKLAFKFILWNNLIITRHQNIKQKKTICYRLLEVMVQPSKICCSLSSTTLNSILSSLLIKRQYIIDQVKTFVV